MMSDDAEDWMQIVAEAIEDDPEKIAAFKRQFPTARVHLIRQDGTRTPVIGEVVGEVDVEWEPLPEVHDGEELVERVCRPIRDNEAAQ